MDWLEKMSHAMDYIESHLTDEIDYCHAARLACCSPYHFQRMFSFITEVSLSEYIRRRRLTLAAFALKNSDIRILDLALRLGYESPEAFSRAFRKMHGVAPSAVRGASIALIAYPRMSFQISIKGATEMNYHITEKPAFRLCGISQVFTNLDGKNFTDIPQFIRKVYEGGDADHLRSALGISPDTCLHGACYDFNENTFSYMIGYDITGDVNPHEFHVLSVPALTWAVLSTPEHPENEITAQIQNLWKRFYSEWLPTSGYEHAEGPELERYYHMENGNYISEVWIPVLKSQ